MTHSLAISLVKQRLFVPLRKNIITTKHRGMNILLLGSGGREHAIAWKLKQSYRLDQLYLAPGNAGTAALGTNLNIKATDFEGIKAAVMEHHIDMVVVGPEEPLVRGIADFFRQDEYLTNIPVIGPDKQGAQLEGYISNIMYLSFSL